MIFHFTETMEIFLNQQLDGCNADVNLGMAWSKKPLHSQIELFCCNSLKELMRISVDLGNFSFILFFNLHE